MRVPPFRLKAKLGYLTRGIALSTRGQLIAPYIVLAGTLSITLSLWTYASRTASTRDNERFMAIAERNATEIETKFRDQASRLRSLGAIFAEDRTPDFSEFNAVAAATLTQSYDSGFLGVGYCPVLGTDKTGRWLKTAKNQYGPSFGVKPKFTPPRTMPTVYIAPLTDSARRAIGFNAMSDPDRAQAIDRSMRTGDIAVTRSVTLYSDRARPQKAVVIYAPVYRSSVSPAQEQQRINQFIGAAFSPVRIAEFFGMIDSSTVGRQMALQIEDSSQTIYESFNVPAEPEFTYTRSLRIGDQNWKVRFVSRPDFEVDRAGRYVPLVPFLGVVISGLLFSLSLAQRMARERAQGHAQELEREVAERRRAEQLVRSLNEDLEKVVQARTQQLEAANQELQSFVYSVSHDLRTPLRTVDGFSHALVEDYGHQLDENGRDYISRVRRAARRMDELIAALLTLSRLNRAEIKWTQLDITEMANVAASELIAQGQYPVQFSLKVAPGLTAYGDSHLVSIVFDNLISNALKFSSKVAAPVIEIGHDGEAFFIRDNGVGFDLAHSTKLFKPFERLLSANEFPGTGIGLATVQRIIARHGGCIWVHSEPGNGATFFFTLPSETPSVAAGVDSGSGS